MNTKQRAEYAKALIEGLRELTDPDGKAMTQADICRESGIPWATLSRWLNGHQAPTSDLTMTTIRRYLSRKGVSVELPAGASK